MSKKKTRGKAHSKKHNMADMPIMDDSADHADPDNQPMKKRKVSHNSKKTKPNAAAKEVEGEDDINSQSSKSFWALPSLIQF